jgi:ribosomal protein S18 acetylase RimI-like enzyme
LTRFVLLFFCSFVRYWFSVQQFRSSVVPQVNMHLHILPCTEVDIPELIEVFKAQWISGERLCLPEAVIATIERIASFDVYVRQHYREMVVAKADGELHGFLYRIDNEIAGIGVNPPAWRRGVGRALMAYAEEECRKSGYQEVFLDVYEPNLPARAFYAALGYRLHDTSINDDYGAPIRSLRMVKELDGG